MAVSASSFSAPSASSRLLEAEGRKFFGDLESLRGVAALSVVVVHCIVAFAKVDRDGLATRLFLDLANGRNAVVLFFVLSGFVLSESLNSGRHAALPLLAFDVKRTFRILPLAYIGLMASAVYLLGFYRASDLSGYAAPWFIQGFYRPTASELIANVLFVSNRMNVVYWTLSVELLASLLFGPLFFLDERLARIGKGAVLFLLIALAWGFFHRVFGIYVLAPPFRFLCGYFFCFQVGILVHKMRPSDAGAILSRHGGVLVAIGFALLCLAHSAIADLLSIPRDAGDPAGGPYDFYEVIIEALGSGILIYGAAGASSRVVHRVLGSSPLRYLGGISYGIYVTHICILKPVFTLLVSSFPVLLARYPLTGPAFALVTVVPLTIVVSDFLRRSVEIPGIELGRTTIKKLGLKTSAGSGRQRTGGSPVQPDDSFAYWRSDRGRLSQEARSR